MMAKRPELVLHIGPGKTGSTSIQSALQQNRQSLLAQGIAYLGVGLEGCQFRPARDWQSPQRIPDLLHSMNAADVKREVQDVLSAELDHLAEAGIRTAVWSNEAIFARREGIGEAIKQLQAEGVSVRIIAYLRRYDDWARSAYGQWGIRHKSYEGAVMPFAEWIAARPPRFAEGLAFWHDQFGPALHLRNFDMMPDVVADFAEFIGAVDLPAIRIYETPPPALLAAWAVHNSRVREERLPDSFRRLLNPSKVIERGVPSAPLPEQMFPTAEEIAQLMAGCRDDIDAVNNILAEKGVAPLHETERSVEKGELPVAPTQWELLQLTMTMVFSLQEQVFTLRKRLDDLERD